MYKLKALLSKLATRLPWQRLCPLPEPPAPQQ